MGNIPVQNKDKKFKPKKVTKMQVEIACMKVKAHLELVKDRKVNELMKDEKALVAMLNAKSRNKVQEVLQAEKVISDLKYIQACTTLMAYANTLKNNCAVIAQSQGNPLALRELIPYIISLSSLNQFKALMLNFFGTDNVQLPIDQVDPKIIEAFKVNSTPYELNTYFIEMAQRNNIPMETINAIGHNINRNFNGPQQNVPQTHPYQNNQQYQQPHQQQPPQQQIYGGNPYRNSVNIEAPQFNHQNNNNNFMPAQNNVHNIPEQHNQGNFNYPTQDFNPFNNKGFQFDTKPIDVPTYNPNKINQDIAQGFNFNSPAQVKPVVPVIPPPKQFETDPYANLLNINEIDDIPLYPQMQRLSLDPNKNKPKAMTDTIKLNNNITPGGFGFDANPTPVPAFNPNYSPQYVPFKADYQPPKNIQSNIYPNTDFKDFAKPQVAQNNFDNFSIDQGFNQNAFDNYKPYTQTQDVGFDKICQEIRKGL